MTEALNEKKAELAKIDPVKIEANSSDFANVGTTVATETESSIIHAARLLLREFGVRKMVNIKNTK